MTRVIAVALLVLGLAASAVAAFSNNAMAASRAALYVEIDGLMMPLTERFLSRAIEEAVKDGAELLVVELNTPGGLLKTSERMVDTILDSPVPVIVFVSPAGSRAASTGTFVTAAGHLAAMAPGTNIGSAFPGRTGHDLLPEPRSSAFNAIEYLVDRIAERRGRDRDALMATVEDAVSYSAQEAVAAGVVDIVAQDVEDLIWRIDGWSVFLNGHEKTLSTRDLALFKIEKTLLEHFLDFISDPNIAFMLMVAGFLALWLEFVAPGALAFTPGITGVILLALAIVALGNLPVSGVGIVLLVLAAVLLIRRDTDAGNRVFRRSGRDQPSPWRPVPVRRFHPSGYSAALLRSAHDSCEPLLATRHFDWRIRTVDAGASRHPEISNHRHDNHLHARFDHRADRHSRHGPVSQRYGHPRR